MIDFVEKYNIDVQNGMTKEEFNLAVDFCIKYLKDELSPFIAKGLCFDSEVMGIANLYLSEKELEELHEMQNLEPVE